MVPRALRWADEFLRRWRAGRRVPIRNREPALDEIDTVLTGHYGFTEQELDFNPNYEITCRLDRDTEGWEA
jgi:hypothetical protein